MKDVSKENVNCFVAAMSYYQRALFKHEYISKAEHCFRSHLGTVLKRVLLLLLLMPPDRQVASYQNPRNSSQRRTRFFRLSLALVLSTMQVCMQEDQLCAFPSTDDSEGTADAGQENMFLGRSNNGLLCCSQTSPDLQWRTQVEVVESWFGQGSRSVATDLHVFHGGTVTGLRYRDEILDPYVRPYAAAIGNDFILMDDNARPHRARIVEESGGSRFGTNNFSDLNLIEHLWDYLGREVAALNPPPRSLHELKQGLLCVWSSLPIPVSDNLINSMGNRCRQCIQVRPIPY
ncbi:DDE_3 domain-containing protein [Trichonephila clavipes]|nr:DDE_3 domain-containing protein [Trichonephila clavipes]